MRTGIYARISEDREAEGLGVKRQLDDCEALATGRGWEIAERYVDNDVSAYSGKPRPEYRRMLADVTAGHIDAVVVYHQDRLVRQPRELEAFLDTCDAAGLTSLASVSGDVDLGTDDGRMKARIMGAVARNSSDAASRRLKRKALEIATNGGVTGGGTRPFGFEADRVTLRADEAAIIRELADRFLTGETLRSLAVDLNARGITTPTGGRWIPTPLRRMLASARISGQREHKGEIVADAKWPAIITREQTTRIRGLLGDPSRQAVRAPRKYLLGRLLRCDACGAALVSRPRDDGSRRYICARGPQYVGCGKTYVLAEPIEEFVTEAVLWRLDTPELAATMRGQSADPPDKFQQQADEITGRLDELAKAYAAGAIAMREWMAAREPLQRRLEAAQRQIGRNGSATVLAPYMGRGGVLRAKWPTLNIERRHAIIAAVLAHVVVHPGRRGFNRFDPERFELVWRY
jgi:site-specific DNA recombinase